MIKFALLDKARQRPEMRPVLAGLSLVFDPDLVSPFCVVEHDAGIIIGPSAGCDEASLAVSLRVAAETALWLGRMSSPPDLVHRIVAALLAARCAAVAHSMMSKAERAACAAVLPPDMLDLFSRDQPPSLSASLVALVRSWVAYQLGAPQLGAPQLGDGSLAADVTLALESDSLRQGWRVASPAEALLTTGGDERLRFDPETGLNRYGSSPRPRPQAITFSSTTATSISEGAFAHVENLRRRLAAAALAGRLENDYGDAMAEVRNAVLVQCGAVPGTEAILTPSGTDAEFYALNLSLAADKRPLVNIVIAPQETASNVMPAAAGRHYNATTAMGLRVKVGDPVDAAVTNRVDLVVLAVRDDNGEPLPASQIDAAVSQAVSAAIAAGKRVLLHLLDTSKTGLVAPGIAATCDLATRFAGSVDVVVDASQLRLSRESVASYLRRGFMVIVTGSKFFTGPPFAGALLVPAAIGDRVLLGHGTLPEGYNAYSERHCWPDSWDTYCRFIGGGANLGLLMRWWAALWEMDAFYAVPTAEAQRILAAFLDAISAAIVLSPVLRLLPCPPPERAALAVVEGCGPLWDSLATILTFALVPKNGVPKNGVPKNGVPPLNFAAAKQVYTWLNQDIAGLLPPTASNEERGLARVCGHIGQPVLIGASEQDGLCGLRLAAGSRLVSGARQVINEGGSVQAFLDLEIAEAKLILAKLEVVLRYFYHLVLEPK